MAVLALGGLGGPGESQAAPGQVAVFSWTLPPGVWVEINLRMAAGAEAVAEFTAEGGAVTWNVHSHPAPAQVLLHDQGSGSGGQVRIHAETEGRYSYLWENPGGSAPVRLLLRLTLTGDARVESLLP